MLLKSWLWKEIFSYSAIVVIVSNYFQIMRKYDITFEIDRFDAQEHSVDIPLLIAGAPPNLFILAACTSFVELLTTW